MANTDKKPGIEQAETKVVTGKVRFSYVHVWEPTAMEGSLVKKYSASLIIPKTDTESIAKINKAIEVAKQRGLTEKFGGKLPPNLKLPLRDGDKERPDDEAYKNSWFINASSNTKPGIVGKDVQPILDQTEFYSGVYGKASVNFYPFNSNGSKGIACGLNHVQKLHDGEALGGRGKAENDFEVEEGGEDLMG